MKDVKYTYPLDEYMVFMGLVYSCAFTIQIKHPWNGKYAIHGSYGIDAILVGG